MFWAVCYFLLPGLSPEVGCGCQARGRGCRDCEEAGGGGGGESRGDLSIQHGISKSVTRVSIHAAIAFKHVTTILSGTRPQDLSCLCALQYAFGILLASTRKDEAEAVKAQVPLIEN